MPSEEFENLPENHVIFITNGDYFKQGYPVYHIERVIRETGTNFSNGAYIMYIDANYDDERDPIARLMHDFKCEDSNKIHNGELKEVVKYLKETDKGELKMESVMDRIMAGPVMNRVSLGLVGFGLVLE